MPGNKCWSTKVAAKFLSIQVVPLNYLIYLLAGINTK